MSRDIASTPAPWTYPKVLSIAGSDSCGGAGIQADLKTIGALGCYGMTAITAITVQNTLGVSAIHSVPPEILGGQIDAVLGDMGAEAVKIGMLHMPEIVHVVGQALDRHQVRQVVLDPVMVATSGDRLIAEDTVSVLVRELFPRATVVTPNLDEAALLLGRAIHGVEDLTQAARALLALGAKAVLLKGGHLASGNIVVDVLVTAGDGWHWFESPRVVTRNLHGTGCTLASAIAAQLALGQPLLQAVQSARDYVLAAIQSGADVQTGHGHGPLNHGHAPKPMVRKPNLSAR
ncbi:MAG TPA: bifunctional hydroxymethylpyrimidine kinase/phosphomethylpyrimidine kinase [Rhizobacter sp.]|nr:bifunctional hydroxymethylpyrimidine kinase/phosphomethylpyrimidine kinase [Rhizobacter sp.]